MDAVSCPGVVPGTESLGMLLTKCFPEMFTTVLVPVVAGGHIVHIVDVQPNLETAATADERLVHH